MRRDYVHSFTGVEGGGAAPAGRIVVEVEGEPEPFVSPVVWSPLARVIRSCYEAPGNLIGIETENPHGFTTGQTIYNRVGGLDVASYRAHRANNWEGGLSINPADEDDPRTGDPDDTEEGVPMGGYPWTVTVVDPFRYTCNGSIWKLHPSHPDPIMWDGLCYPSLVDAWPDLNSLCNKIQGRPHRISFGLGIFAMTSTVDNPNALLRPSSIVLPSRSVIGGAGIDSTIIFKGDRFETLLFRHYSSYSSVEDLWMMHGRTHNWKTTHGWKLTKQDDQANRSQIHIRRRSTRDTDIPGYGINHGKPGGKTYIDYDGFELRGTTNDGMDVKGVINTNLDGMYGGRVRKATVGQNGLGTNCGRTKAPKLHLDPDSISTTAGIKEFKILLASRYPVASRVYFWPDTPAVGGLTLAGRAFRITARSIVATVITPVGTADSIETEQGSYFYKVHFPGHGVKRGWAVDVSGAANVGGIDPNGVNMRVTSAVQPDFFVYEGKGGLATSNDNGGGAAISISHRTSTWQTTLLHEDAATSSVPGGGGSDVVVQVHWMDQKPGIDLRGPYWEVDGVLGYGYMPNQMVVRLRGGDDENGNGEGAHDSLISNVVGVNTASAEDTLGFKVLSLVAGDCIINSLRGVNKNGGGATFGLQVIQSAHFTQARGLYFEGFATGIISTTDDGLYEGVVKDCATGATFEGRKGGVSVVGSAEYLAVTQGSGVVRVHWVDHGVLDTNKVTVSDAAPIGGLDPNVVETDVIAVLDDDNFTYQAAEGQEAAFSAQGGGEEILITVLTDAWVKSERNRVSLHLEGNTTPLLIEDHVGSLTVSNSRGNLNTNPVNLSPLATNVKWFDNQGLPDPSDAPVEKIADFAVSGKEFAYRNNKVGSTCVVTLLPAAEWPGKTIRFINGQAQPLVSGSANVVPLAGGAADTAILAATAGAWADVRSNGASWLIVAAA